MLPLNFNFAQDVIDRWAGDLRAGLLFVDAYGHRRDYTFAEISEQSQRYAAALQALGVTLGSRVLLCTANTAKGLFTLLALARLGAVAVPCPDDCSSEHLIERARSAAVEAVIADRRRRPHADALHAHLPESTSFFTVGETAEGWARIDTLAAAAAPFRGVTTQSLDMAYVFEDAVLDYGKLFEDRSHAQSALDIRESDCVWAAIPFGSQQWLMYAQLPWWYGASTVVHEGAFDARERLELARELEVTMLLAHPQEFAAHLDLPDSDRFRLPKLRRCIATEAIDEATQQRWSERFGLEVSSLTHAAPTPA